MFWQNQITRLKNAREIWKKRGSRKKSACASLPRKNRQTATSQHLGARQQGMPIPLPVADRNALAASRVCGSTLRAGGMAVGFVASRWCAAWRQALIS